METRDKAAGSVDELAVPEFDGDEGAETARVVAAGHMFGHQVANVCRREVAAVKRLAREQGGFNPGAQFPAHPGAIVGVGARL